VGEDILDRTVRNLAKYVGITYPGFLCWKIWWWAVSRLWKRFLCSWNIHLFDEVISSEHYLNCDACGLMVHINKVETSEEACRRIEELSPDKQHPDKART